MKIFQEHFLFSAGVSQGLRVPCGFALRMLALVKFSVLHCTLYLGVVWILRSPPIQVCLQKVGP